VQTLAQYSPCFQKFQFDAVRIPASLADNHTKWQKPPGDPEGTAGKLRADNPTGASNGPSIESERNHGFAELALHFGRSVTSFLPSLFLGDRLTLHHGDEHSPPRWEL
jgi:hypothetical protein